MLFAPERLMVVPSGHSVESQESTPHSFPWRHGSERHWSHKGQRFL